jgi:hypothetical protein
VDEVVLLEEVVVVLLLVEVLLVEEVLVEVLLLVDVLLVLLVEVVLPAEHPGGFVGTTNGVVDDEWSSQGVAALNASKVAYPKHSLQQFTRKNIMALEC